MMGRDCERIISGINKIKDVINGILPGVIAIVSADSGAVPTPPYVNPIESQFKSMEEDKGKIDSLKSSLFTSPESFFNSYGSPWKEFEIMNKAIQDIIDYKSDVPVMVKTGEKAALMGLMNRALSLCVDCKLAFTLNQDYIQRGFDYEFNNGVASVTFRAGINKVTTGNVIQSTNGVNTPSKSNDPY